MLNGMVRLIVRLTVLCIRFAIRLVLLGVTLIMSLLRTRRTTWSWIPVPVSVLDVRTTVTPTTLVVEFRTGVPSVFCLVVLCTPWPGDRSLGKH